MRLLIPQTVLLLSQSAPLWLILFLYKCADTKQSVGYQMFSHPTRGKRGGIEPRSWPASLLTALTTRTWQLMPPIANLVCFSIPAPPTDIRLIYFRPNPDQINLTCSVSGVYPKPDVRLSWGRRYSL